MHLPAFLGKTESRDGRARRGRQTFAQRRIRVQTCAGTIVLHNVCGLDSDVMVTKNVDAC